ncbi:MAG: 4-hydroxy-tetrahydrodipicolinate synthase [Acidimicrobiales bacterium]
MDQAAHPRFGGLLTAMVTPFDGSGALDLDGARTLARWLVDHGSQGLVVTGTTGEGPTVTDAEKRDLWRAVKEAVTVPIVAGAGTNDTAHSVEMARAATDAGADAVLAVTPYYSRPPQSGIRRHMTAVAEATELPVMIYDIPIRTGRAIALDTMVGLATEVKNIVAVKDSTKDLPRVATLQARTPSSFEIYCGDDDLALAMLSLGAVGAVSVASHWAGLEMAELISAQAKGDLAGAHGTNARLIESFEFESSEAFPNPLPAKAACRALGLPAGQCRDPLGPAPAELDDMARRVLEGLGTSVG